MNTEDFRYAHVNVPETEAVLVGIADLHLGSKAAQLERFREEVRFVRDTASARAVLLGDMMDCGLEGSKTGAVEANKTIKEQREALIEELRPIADKIVGAVEGNHEHRLRKASTLSVTEDYCDKLGVPFLGYCGIIEISVGQRDGGRANQSYGVCIHHTSGGGATPGAKVNAVHRLRDIAPDCDIYLGAHRHGASWVTDEAYLRPGARGSSPRRLIRHYVSVPAFLEWGDSYAVQKPYPPQAFVPVRLRLAGESHHASGHRVTVHFN